MPHFPCLPPFEARSPLLLADAKACRSSLTDSVGGGQGRRRLQRALRTLLTLTVSLQPQRRRRRQDQPERTYHVSTHAPPPTGDDVRMGGKRSSHQSPAARSDKATGRGTRSVSATVDSPPCTSLFPALFPSPLLSPFPFPFSSSAFAFAFALLGSFLAAVLFRQICPCVERRPPRHHSALPHPLACMTPHNCRS